MRQGFSSLERAQSNLVTVPYLRGILAHAATYGTNSFTSPQSLPIAPQPATATAIHPQIGNSLIGPQATPLPPPQIAHGPNHQSAIPPSLQLPNASVIPAPLQPPNVGASSARMPNLQAPLNNIPRPRPMYRSATEMFEDWYGIGTMTRYPPGGIDHLNRVKDGWPALLH